MVAAARTTQTLPDGATVAIVGRGPAGSFLAIHRLRLARTRRQDLRVVIFERRRPPPKAEPGTVFGPYKGCPRCAGGVSSRLSAALAALDIHIPGDVRQMRIRSITVQGRWKPIHLHVPEDRHMLSVYRRPLRGSGDFDDRRQRAQDYGKATVRTQYL
jgi:2-polyprenyl-6-methoxyphenol hydroxylase-like FAD-dependent oxidoreductase